MPNKSPDQEALPTREDLAEELLLSKMEEYSEGFFCAGWFSGLEFDLWQAADLGLPNKTQKHEVTLSRKLRALGRIAGGWWVIEDETCPDEDSPFFIPVERWNQILSERNPGK